MSQPDIRTELQRAAPEPLLPVEKKLIGFSLGTGLVLLVVLAIINYFVPATFCGLRARRLPSAPRGIAANALHTDGHRH